MLQPVSCDAPRSRMSGVLPTAPTKPSRILGSKIQDNAGRLTDARGAADPHGVAYLLRLDHAALQLLVAAFVAEPGFRLRLHEREDAIGAGGGRVHAEHAHAVLARALAHALGEGRQAGVGGAAAQVLEGRVFPRHADDVDDDAALARLHAAEQLARQVDVAVHLQFPSVPPLALVQRLDGAAGDVARVVDQDVAVSARLREVVQRSAVAQVHRVQAHVDAAVGGANRSAHRLEQLAVSRRQVQVAALGGKRRRASETDPLGAAGDQDGLAFQSEIHGAFLGGWPVEVAPARLAYGIAILADQRAAQERRLDARAELDAFERRVALRRSGFPGAHRPALARIDQRQVRVEALGDVALGVQAETAGRIETE